jgi:hypothetical protein
MSTVIGDGGDVAADGVPVAGDLLGAEPTRYLLLGSWRAAGRVRPGWSRRDPQAGGEPRYVSLPVAKALEQVAAGLLPGTRGTSDRPTKTPCLNAWSRGAVICRGGREDPGDGRCSPRG